MERIKGSWNHGIIESSWIVVNSRPHAITDNRYKKTLNPEDVFAIEKDMETEEVVRKFYQVCIVFCGFFVSSRANLHVTFVFVLVLFLLVHFSFYSFSFYPFFLSFIFLC
jgi:hypothetical protein